jgi:hypothetical protein
MDVEDFSPLMPDLLVPSQWCDLHRSNGPDEPIKKLMREMLRDALWDALGAHPEQHKQRRAYEQRCPEMALRRAALKKRRARRRAVEALGWLFDDRDDGVFAFVSVCNVLGIDCESLRARVREQVSR